MQLEDMEKSEIETLKNQIKLWKSKYQSQCSKMGAYKTKIQKEVKQREDDVKWKEEWIKQKEEFLKNNNYESIREEANKVNNERKEVERKDFENRKQLEKDFETMKQEIIDELSQELIRWTEENDIDNQRSQGYIIGINKAKKIIKEKLIFKLKEKTIYLERILNEKII